MHNLRALRRDPRCHAADFWHRIRVGLVIFLLITGVRILFT